MWSTASIPSVSASWVMRLATDTSLARDRLTASAMPGTARVAITDV